MTGSFPDRLIYFNNEFLHLVGGSNLPAEFTVEENSQQGQARIQVQVHNPCLCFHRIDQRKFEYVKEKRCADSVVMEILPTHGWRLHIFELKKRVGHKEWLHIVQQFQGAFLRALALAGILGFGDPVSTTCYTGFRQDAMQSSATADTVLLKPLAYSPSQGHPYYSWTSGRLHLADFAWAKHVKVPLNVSTGDGYIDVS
ncbi:MAG: hypothetical protein K6T78_15285 [Alicyclobacillus sp.]|nr:hypothetical protein [Alicyclobacillus sp.]